MTNKLLASLFFAAVITLSFSCSKSSGDSDITSFVRMNKNSAWVNFSATGKVGPNFIDSSLTDLTISALNFDSTEVFTISIEVDSTSFPTGPYVTGVPSPMVVMDLVTNAKTFPVIHTTDDAPGRAPSQYTIIITSITDDFINGRFYGNYLFDGFGGVSVYDIPEGEFHVRRMK